jgi:hypothetical protein
MGHAHPLIKAKLLHPVQGISGRTYPGGTELRVAPADGSSVDAFVGGDWLPLSWWEYAPVELGGSSGPWPAA